MTKNQSETQNKSKDDISFSDWELDVANLLLQLSHHKRDSENNNKMKKIKIRIKYKKKDVVAKQEQHQEQEPESSVASSSASSSAVVSSSYSGDQEGYPKRRVKRFKLMDQIYGSTQPIQC
ncbi:hypothetical protein M5689_000802 [Euphorbia peplus]|nr:hypothetical protein M5689_000802 [Euphorbia peplus]